MTAAELQTLAAATAAAVLVVESVTEQARLRGLTVETFGLTHGQERLIAKLRTLRDSDPQTFTTIQGVTS